MMEGLANIAFGLALGIWVRELWPHRLSSLEKVGDKLIAMAAKTRNMARFSGSEITAFGTLHTTSHGEFELRLISKSSRPIRERERV